MSLLFRPLLLSLSRSAGCQNLSAEDQPYTLGGVIELNGDETLERIAEVSGALRKCCEYLRIFPLAI
jgi:hypothetical protein